LKREEVRLQPDILYIVINLFAICIAGANAVLNYSFYRKISAAFYSYSTIVYIFAVISFTNLMIPALYSSSEYGEIIHISFMLLSPLIYLALAFLVAAVESTKRDTMSPITNSAFFVAGILVVGTFHPDAYHVEWTLVGWVFEFSLYFQIGRIILFLICLVSVLPIAMTVWKRIKRVVKKEIILQFLLVSTVILVTFGLVMQGFNRSQLQAFIGLYHPLTFPFAAGLALLLMFVLLWLHPTILLAGANDIKELFIISRGSGLPLYFFDFMGREERHGQEILSAFFTSIRHYLRFSLKAGDLDRIQIGDNEVLVAEGLLTYGILVASGSSVLLLSLLTSTVQEFEAQYGFELDETIMSGKFNEFNEQVHRFFEFAIPLEKE
jgi:hypothetical protein